MAVAVGAAVAVVVVVGFVVAVVAVVAAVFIPATTPDHEEHLNHAELAIVPGGTLTEG